MADEKDMIRAFIGIDIPEVIKDKISELKKELQIEHIRFVSKENMHITLFFLGDIDQRQVEEVKDVLEKIDRKPFYASVVGIGTFSIKRPNILFAKISDGNKEISNIYDMLIHRIKEFGIRMDHRAYDPHITIARIPDTREREQINEFVNRNSRIELGRFECRSVNLKQSMLTSSGPVYHDLYVKELD